MKESRVAEGIFDLVLISLMVAMVVISARLSLMIGPVPITMQTLSVILTGLLLLPGKSWLVPTIYLFMGLLGFPVFSGGGGIGYIFKPTFGFLLGFIPATSLTGYLYRLKWFKRDKINVVIATFAGIFVIYLFGFGYIPLAGIFFGTELAVMASILPSLPFMIIGEFIKTICLAMIVPLLTQELEKARQPFINR